MLIRYTAALFNNAVFSKTVWASRVCLCLIRLGRGSIVDGEDSAAKLKYSDESPQCWSTYPLCWPWWSYSRGKRYPTSADTITFLKAEKQPVRSSVRCYCVTWWFLLAGIHTDTKWRCLITLELLCSLGKKMLSYKHDEFRPSTDPTLVLFHDWQTFTVWLSSCSYSI